MGKWVGGLFYPDAKDTLALTQAGASPAIIGAYNQAVAGGGPLPSNLAGSEPMAGGGGAGGGGAGGAGSTGVPVGLLEGLLPGYDWGSMGNLGVVGIDVLDAIYPYLTFDAQQALTRELEQMRQSGYIQSAGMQASATLGAAQAAAGATTASAQIRSAADIKIAGMQAEAQLKAIREQIIGDLQRVLMGEQGAANRLQAELLQAAQLANQAMRLEVAEKAASSGLRDAIAARFYVRGLGDQPAIGSSFLAGPLQEIVAPSVGTPSMPAGMVQGTSGGAAMPTGGGDYASRVKNALGRSAGFAKGTPGSGQGILVGEAGPEVIRLGPRGIEVIPLVGKAQAGARIPYDTTQPTTTRRAPGQTLAESGWKPMVPGGAGGVFTWPAQEYVDPGSWIGEGPPPSNKGYRSPLGYKPDGTPILPGEYYDYRTGQWVQDEPSPEQLLQAGLATQGTAFGQPAGGILVPGISTGTPSGLPAAMTQGLEQLNTTLGTNVTPESLVAMLSNIFGITPGGGGEFEPPRESWYAKRARQIESANRLRGWDIPEGGGSPTVFTPPTEPPVTPPAIDPITGLPIPEPVAPPAVPGGYTTEPPPVVGGPPIGGTTPPITDLSDLANIPAFQAARRGKAYPAWPNMTNPVELGAGMGTLPWPAQLAGVWQQLSPQDQEDLLAAFEFAGIPRAVALQMLLRGTPGYRGSPAKAFRVF